MEKNIAVGPGNVLKFYYFISKEFLVESINKKYFMVEINLEIRYRQLSTLLFIR